MEEMPVELGSKPPFQYSIRTLMILTTGVAVFLAFVAMPILRSREAARRNTCFSNIRQMALAMHNYESGNGYFLSQNFYNRKGQTWSTKVILGPVAATNVPGDTSGIPSRTSSYSFITQLLPQFEEGGMLPAIRFDKNPFHTLNSKYCCSALPVLQCPSFSGMRETIGADYVTYNNLSWKKARKPMLTQYVAMGATTYDNLYRTAKATTSEPDGMIFSNKETKIDDVSDGMANTIMLCETSEEKYAVWMDGTTASLFGITAVGQTTLNLDGASTPYLSVSNFGGTEDWHWGPSSMHGGMAHHAFGDGAVRSISDDIEADVYRALITRASKIQYGVSDAESAASFFDE